MDPRTKSPGDRSIFLVWLVYSVALLYPSIQRYRSLHSHFWDMGAYQNELWNHAWSGIGQFVFQQHFSPIMSVYALFYKIMPYGETLLVLQSLSISVAVFPLYAYAADVLGKEKALTVVGLYCLFSPVWLINLTNFHPDSLMIPLGLSALYFQMKGRTVLFHVFMVLLLTIKEISFFIVSLIYLYGALKYKRGISQYILSVVMFIAGLLVVDVIMPAIVEDVSLMKNAGVKWLGHDMGDVLQGAALNPQGVAGRLLNPWKVAYVVMLFGSFLFVPFLAPLSLLPALPGISLSLLSDYWRVQSLAFHYPSTVVPFIMVAFVEGLAARAPLKNGFFKVVIGVFLLLNASHLGFFLLYKNDSYHYSRYVVSERDERNRAALKRHIPGDPSAVVSSSNLVNHAILANREHCLKFPGGVVESDESPLLADYVVYDRKREKEVISFLQQRGLESQKKGLKKALAKYETSEKAFETASEYFEVLFENDEFFILKRRSGITGRG